MRTAALTAMTILAATVARGAEAEAEAWGPKLAIESYRLPNGLKVALHRDSSLPRVVVCVAYHVGSRNERAGRTGFAHFFEHMMFRGTSHVPNYDIPLQETGAQSNAFTSEDMTVYHETVASEFLERALYLEAERLAFLPSALEQGKFDTEREVVKNERRQSVDNVPYGLAEEALLANVFPKGHPYSWSVIGSMKDLDRASLDDLKAFFAEFYHPANATLCLAGDFDPARARALIEHYFGPLAAGPIPEPSAARPTPVRTATLELADAVELPRIHWAWPTVNEDHPDAPALGVLASVLASSETSRLYKSLVRDRRLAKDVSADDDSKEVGGFFTIEATAAEGKSTSEIEDVLRKEIALLKADPPSLAEIQRVRARLETATYAGLTTTLGRATALATGFAQKGDPEHYRRELKRIFQVAPEDVQRVAVHYLTDEKVRLLVRPLKPGESKSTMEPVSPSTGLANPGAKVVNRPPAAAGPDWAHIPASTGASRFQPPAYTKKTLSNGISVWIAAWKTLPLVRVSLSIPTGTGDDPEGKSGLAQLTTRLLDQGTADRTATELAEAAEQLGATLRTGVGSDETGIGVSVLSRNVRPMLELLAEVLMRPRFDPTDFDRERSQQLGDLLQGPENISWLARRALPAVMFGAGHPYGKPAEGYPETVKRLSLDDVREFHARAMGPRGTVLIVTGDVDSEALLLDLERTLGRWRGTNDGPRPRPASDRIPWPGKVSLVDKPGAVQSQILIGRHWVDRRDPRYMATLVGNHLLGEDFLSRLNKNLREEHGYTYGAGSGFSFRRGQSVWQASTSVRGDATAPALAEIVHELDDLAGKTPITAKEIATAKSARARSYPEEFESPSGIAEALSEIARFSLPVNTLDTFLPSLDQVSSEEIQKAMTEVVSPSARFLIVVGDRKTIEPELKKAGFQLIEAITFDGKPVGK